MRTNYFRKQDKQYHGSMSYKLSSPTNDTRDVLGATKMLSKRIFKERNLTVIIVSHDLAEAKFFSDRLFSIQNGVLVEQ